MPLLHISFIMFVRVSTHLNKLHSYFCNIYICFINTRVSCQFNTSIKEVHLRHRYLQSSVSCNKFLVNHTSGLQRGQIYYGPQEIKKQALTSYTKPYTLLYVNTKTINVYVETLHGKTLKQFTKILATDTYSFKLETNSNQV